MSSPTQRSLKWLRERGFRAQVVERWNQYAMRRIDLFGVGDIVAVGGKIILLQTTSGGGLTARIKKCREEDHARAIREWIRAGGLFLLHGWRTIKGRWRPRIVLSEIVDGELQFKEVGDGQGQIQHLPEMWILPGREPGEKGGGARRPERTGPL